MLKQQNMRHVYRFSVQVENVWQYPLSWIWNSCQNHSATVDIPVGKPPGNESVKSEFIWWFYVSWEDLLWAIDTFYSFWIQRQEVFQKQQKQQQWSTYNTQIHSLKKKLWIWMGRLHCNMPFSHSNHAVVFLGRMSSHSNIEKKKKISF